MTWIRFVLMLYFFMVAPKAACQTLSKALEVYEDMVEVLLVLEIILSNRLKIFFVVLLPALKPACSSAMISACGFDLFSMVFSMTFLGWLMRLIVQ